MRALLSRPQKAYLVLGVAIVLFFALSAVGHTGTPAENAASSIGWIGSIGWAGFLLSLLAVVAYTVALAVQRLLSGRSTDGRSASLLEERP